MSARQYRSSVELPRLRSGEAHSIPAPQYQDILASFDVQMLMLDGYHLECAVAVNEFQIIVRA